MWRPRGAGDRAPRCGVLASWTSFVGLVGAVWATQSREANPFTNSETAPAERPQMGNKTVRDVMMPEPWTVDANVSIQEAAHSMRAWDLRDVLVTDRGELRGVLTDQDIIVLAIASGRHPS